MTENKPKQKATIYSIGGEKTEFFGESIVIEKQASWLTVIIDGTEIVYPASDIKLATVGDFDAKDEAKEEKERQRKECMDRCGISTGPPEQPQEECQWDIEIYVNGGKTDASGMRTYADAEGAVINLIAKHERDTGEIVGTTDDGIVAKYKKAGDGTYTCQVIGKDADGEYYFTLNKARG